VLKSRRFANFLFVVVIFGCASTHGVFSADGELPLYFRHRIEKIKVAAGIDAERDSHVSESDLELTFWGHFGICASVRGYRFQRVAGTWTFQLIDSVPKCVDSDSTLGEIQELPADSKLSTALFDLTLNLPESRCADFSKYPFPPSIVVELKDKKGKVVFGYFDIYAIVGVPEYSLLNRTCRLAQELSWKDSKRLRDGCCESIYWDFIIHRAAISGFDDLESLPLSNGDWEVRLWMGFAHCDLTGCIISSTSGNLQAFLLEPMCADFRFAESGPIRSLLPRSGWDEVTAFLERFVFVLSHKKNSDVRDDENKGKTDGPIITKHTLMCEALEFKIGKKYECLGYVEVDGNTRYKIMSFLADEFGFETCAPLTVR